MFACLQWLCKVFLIGNYIPGFFHTAFSLRAEGRLEQSEHFNEYIPRGELVELLTKALLYIEVETHCKGDGLVTDCQTPFSLLKRHECTAAEVMEDVVVNGTAEKTTGKESASNGIVEVPLKRKADVPAEGDAQERRVKRVVDMEVADSNSAAGPDCELTYPVHILLTCFVSSRVIFN